MLNTATATARIQRELADLERASNESLMQAAALMQTMMIARLETDVAATTGQAAVARLSAAQAALVTAQNEIARTHRELLKVGVEVKMMPDETECPPAKGTADQNIRLVG